MLNLSSALLADAGTASERRPFGIGDTVRVTYGTPDPDFPGMRLDGWIGEVVDVDAAHHPARYLVQWNEKTLRRMSRGYHTRCGVGGMVLDQMWLFDEDLDACRSTSSRSTCPRSSFPPSTVESRLPAMV